MKFDLRDPRKQRLVLLGLACVAIAYFYFMRDGIPHTYRTRARAVEELRGERDKLTQDLQKARAGNERLEALNRERDELARRWLEVEASLPADHDSPEFLSEVTGLGHHESLEFLLFEPKEVRPVEFYQEAPVSVRLEGNYHQIGRFLACLDNMPRIVRVSALRVSSNPRASDDESEPSAVADMEISAYFRGNPVAPLPGETDEPGKVNDRVGQGSEARGKGASGKATAGKAPAGKAPAKQAPAKQAPAKQAPAKRTPAKQAPAGRPNNSEPAYDSPGEGS